MDVRSAVKTIARRVCAPMCSDKKGAWITARALPKRCISSPSKLTFTSIVSPARYAWSALAGVLLTSTAVTSGAPATVRRNPRSARSPLASVAVSVYVASTAALVGLPAIVGGDAVNDNPAGRLGAML